jgi:AcrR family transcriptional regulator
MAQKSQAAGGHEAATGPKTDARTAIVDALLKLAAGQRFEDITITDICSEAKVSLADFRDCFPSKGAVLGGFSRRIDRAVLGHKADENSEEAAKERLFDVLMRRLEAMAPYRDALREITQYLRRDPMAALAFNQSLVNSMRFMLEAAGISHEGAAGAIKLQGLVFAWARIVDVWLADEEPGLAKTMAELDRVLTCGEKSVGALERLDDIAAPFKALTRAVFETRRRAAENFRRRPSGSDEEPDVDERHRSH